MKSPTTAVLAVFGALMLVFPSGLRAKPGTDVSTLSGPADIITAALDDPHLRALATRALAQNPGLAAHAAQVRAAVQRAPQVASLPDPTASLTLFLMQPQTRVGPQQASVTLTQKMPWFGTLGIRERVALLEAGAANLKLQESRIELVTDLRVGYHRLQGIEREMELLEEELATLQQYEKMAQARYASGAGIGQPVIKIQTEISRIGVRLIEQSTLLQTVRAALNSLLDQPAGAPIETGPIQRPSVGALDIEKLQRHARIHRPAVMEAARRIEAAAAGIKLAEASARPNFAFGLNYGFVGDRVDDAGRAKPPEDDGRDIFGISGGVSIPIWKSKNDAAREQSVESSLAAEHQHRAVTRKVVSQISDIAQQVPLLQHQLDLYESTLLIQAEQSLRSAESAYVSGLIGALDLLDAERLLFELRRAAEHTKTNLAVIVARLEGAAATPVRPISEGVMP